MFKKQFSIKELKKPEKSKDYRVSRIQNIQQKETSDEVYGQTWRKY